MQLEQTTSAKCLYQKKDRNVKCEVECSSRFYGIIKVSCLRVDVYFASVSEWLQQ